MYFNDRVFNPQYMNEAYYAQAQREIEEYNSKQSQEVLNAVKAVGDLCKAVKKMDNQHQEVAFYACLAKMAEELGWNNK